MIHYVIIGLLLLVYMVLVFLLGGMFDSGTLRWVFRVVFWLLGLAGGGILIYRHWKSTRAKPEPTGGLSAADLDYLLGQAERKLKAGGRGKASDLPLLFVLGTGGSAKTTSVLRAGVSADLLEGNPGAGLVPESTTILNLWLVDDRLILEASPALAKNEDLWRRLMRRLRPGAFKAMFSAGASPRAALVCVSCEDLTGLSNAEGARTLGKAMREPLRRASAALGMDIPVYVLFTKLDRVSFFTDFLSRYTIEEADEPLGVTLRRTASASGAYEQEENQRLRDSFEQVFLGLSANRLVSMPREPEGTKRPAQYEFPREFGKLSAVASSFLMELCRPHQINRGPYLRGFYFSGVRPVEERAPAFEKIPEPTQAKRRNELATLFGGDGSSRDEPALEKAKKTRRAPHWAFLRGFFQKILLGDSLLKEAAGSRRSSMLRRVALVGASVLLVGLLGAFSLSYLRNSALIERAQEASQRIHLAGTQATAEGVAPLASLEALDELRRLLLEVRGQLTEGAPWSMRWGLYVGDDLYVRVRTVYFQHFRNLLLTSSRAGLEESLLALPSEPADAFPEGPTYDKLRAYLVTERFNQCSSPAVLTPPLLTQWKLDRQTDARAEELARANFDFYAVELQQANPYELHSDEGAIERARRYLAGFSGFERAYNSLLAEAAAGAPSFQFNRDVPGSDVTVVNTYEVPAAFTKQGWQTVAAAIQARGSASRKEGCDALIMGEFGQGEGLSNIEAQLLARYLEDFRKHWLSYLRATRVRGYASPNDAVGKLRTSGGPQSAVLGVIGAAANHTAEGPQEAAEWFQPAHVVVPPTPGGSGGAAEENAGYRERLLGLGDGWDSLAKNPQGCKDAVATQELAGLAQMARSQTNQMTLAFRGDPAGNVAKAVRGILVAPIDRSDALLRACGAQDLNRGGKGLCDQFTLLKRKFPFNPNAAEEATEQELAAFFHPNEGALAQLYEAELKDVLDRTGPQGPVRPRADSTIKLNPTFVTSFNRLTAVGRSLYPPGATGLRLTYTLQAEPQSLFDMTQLRVQGQEVRAERKAPAPVPLESPGDRSDAQLVGLIGRTPLQLLSFPSGLWSTFRFFASAARVPASGNGLYEWRPTTSGQPVRVDGEPVVLRYQVQHGANEPLLQKGYWASLNCVARVTR